MSILTQKNGKRLSRTIDYNEIQFDNQVGSGGFGKVFAGYLNGRKIGIKKITIYENDPNKDTLLKFIERETVTLKMFSHPNVIQYYGIAEKERSFFLLTELVSGGDLHWYIKNPQVKISWRLKLMIAKDIAASMVYLHNNNVIHRDLKSTNLLVAENWVIKVCDFGLARKIDLAAQSQMTICGTDDWMAPEVLLGDPYDKSCDVFSFGVVLIELITRLKLTPRVRNENLGIDQTYVVSKTPKDCPKEFLDLVFHCCRERPQLRPTFTQIEQLITYLLDTLTDLGDVDYPPLRSFEPPQLTMSQIAKNNNNNNSISGSNQSFPRPYVSTEKKRAGSISSSKTDSFPRPYQGSNYRPPTPQQLVQQQQQQAPTLNESVSSTPSNFSFPRPYQPSDDTSDSSSFSFPRPYQPSEGDSGSPAQTNNTDFMHMDDPEQQPPQEYEYDYNSVGGEDEYQQLQQQQEYNPDDYQYSEEEDTVVNFYDSELLSFPRPYQPEGESDDPVSTSPLLKHPDYSFPRPWSPEYDPPLPAASSPPPRMDLATQPTTSSSSSSPQPQVINVQPNPSPAAAAAAAALTNMVDERKNTFRLNITNSTGPSPNVLSSPSTPKATNPTTPKSKRSSTTVTPITSSPPISPQKAHISVQDRIKKLLTTKKGGSGGGGSSTKLGSGSSSHLESPTLNRKTLNTKEIIQKFEEITKSSNNSSSSSAGGGGWKFGSKQSFDAPVDTSATPKVIELSKRRK
ncbi:hypothetical protein SAMD00019534_091770 [Acytostelium subglobosum LB1]|uniref:hypothetical protein n=1 Tax=Acytostelium subglobosum LB1 TaxID=1410327 RepID=UPI0006447EE8|nr:hypothetical protein SAMD00019534_091770 [Acytostelium subglobosum LB1]GAM26002.1 hypothetical protein SAMD00019534_091770 [Acytostelium subglobosum LB1]|eukprot:XP_012751045.1 hypothetical protein SAMD00019534_091770 [Acytostelium subglobosum LB1]